MRETDTYRIKYLLDIFSSQQASHAELEELTGLLQSGRHDEQIKSLLEKMGLETNSPFGYSEDLLNELFTGVQNRINNDPSEFLDKIPVINIEKNRPKSRLYWKRIAVAASIILMAGFSYYLLFLEKEKTSHIVQATKVPEDIKAPEAHRAMITLTNGKTVYLDDAVNGQLVQQGNVQLVKLADGQIAYQATPGEITDQVQYNTLINPYGSKVINMKLADGSRVWLNAGSSITYPITFPGNIRQVEMTGEGYFEVAKNELKPFKVRIPKVGEIEVLGTKFNINSYNNEPNIKTTLVEGKIKLNTLGANQSLVLTPGQQAQYNLDGKIILNKNPDLQSVVAWKEDKFIFHNADLYFIMRQLERWYDIEVSYNGEDYTDEFVGIISRNVNISEILKMLEKTGNVKFELNGRQLFVK